MRERKQDERNQSWQVFRDIIARRNYSDKILEVAVGTLGTKGPIDMIHFQFGLDATGRQWHSAGLSMFRGLLAKVGVLARWYIGRVDNTYSELLDNTPPFRTRVRVLKVTTTTSSPSAAKYINEFKETSRIMRKTNAFYNFARVIFAITNVTNNSQT